MKEDYQSENKKLSVTENAKKLNNDGNEIYQDSKPAPNSGKLDLADVIIAAAAAKTVKLKSKGIKQMFQFKH